MDYKEAIAYIENFTWSSTKLGLERTFELLSKIGNPHKKLKFVHITGSNGKGSTCAMIESVLRTAGYRTGLYTSPYIEDFCERIQVCGKKISHKRLAEITEIVSKAADSMQDHPSQFEIVTAIGMQYFFEEKCDIVVLEVGMGGTYDSTNVIDAPELAVITNIGLEHTEYLGSTLEAIAKTKAGIIKPGCSCVCYDGEKAVTEVIRDDCKSKSVPLYCLDKNLIHPLKRDLSAQSFELEGKEYSIPLLGKHQLCNAQTAIKCIEVLKKIGYKISDNDLLTGLKNTFWPARFEVLGTDPIFILDGGHNPQCADAMAQCLRDYLPDKKITFITGVLADKNYGEIYDKLIPFAEEFICLTPQSPRALPAEDLKKYLESLGQKASAYQSVKEVYNKYRVTEKTGRCFAAFGSLYLAGIVRTEYNKLIK